MVGNFIKTISLISMLMKQGLNKYTRNLQPTILNYIQMTSEKKTRALDIY